MKTDFPSYFIIHPSYFDFLLADDTVFPHPGTEGTGVEAKEDRRPAFPFDSPTGFPEHLKDVIVLQLCQGFDLLSWQFL